MKKRAFQNRAFLPLFCILAENDLAENDQPESEKPQFIGQIEKVWTFSPGKRQLLCAKVGGAGCRALLGPFLMV
jgi:hypothetical protein